MEIVHTIGETREVISAARERGKSVGLVPTMGCFHEGHLWLMRRARRENGLLVISIFVNPTQFGPSEDVREYPRDVDRDAQMAEQIGVDVIFNPSAEEMYPEGCDTYVGVGKLGEMLCGASRPGHFRGVATVVLKLFEIVQPDRAYFGRKDYQQLKVIERMVNDFNMPVEIVPVPTVREPDGLAMSSRNTYLGPAERQAAPVLSRSLSHAQELLDQGVTSGAELRRRVEEFIGREPLAELDYVAVVDPETLEAVADVERQAVLALAVRIGKTRLIDNTLLTR